MTVFAFGVIPLILLVGLLAAGKWTLYDFRGDPYNAGKAIAAGRNPYGSHFLAQAAAAKRHGGAPNPGFAVPVYPAPALLASVPLSLLPYRVAVFTFLGASVLSLIAGLRLLGVRDWRCMGAAGLSFPVLHSLALGALDPFLLLGIAAAWRWRESAPKVAVAVAPVVIAKVFLWPIAVWLMVTRRYRAAALAIAVAVLGTLLAWAAIGFDGLLNYPHLLQNLSFVEEDAGISLVAAFHWLGIAHSFARLVSCAGTGLLLLAAWRVRSCRYGAERSLGFAILAALTASPIVWTQYLTLLLIPIALLSPSLSPMWLVLVIPWPFIPWMTSHMDAHLFASLPFLAVEIAVLLRLLVPSAKGHNRSVATVEVPAVEVR